MTTITLDIVSEFKIEGDYWWGGRHRLIIYNYYLLLITYYLLIIVYNESIEGGMQT